MNSHSLNTEKTILLVEDDPGHALLIRKWFRREGLNYPIVHVVDGQFAMDYLTRQGAYSDVDGPMPAVMLLDLSMPRLTGIQVMERMSGDSTLSEIPIIVTTTSDDSDDIKAAAEYGYVDYYIKPQDYSELAHRIDSLLA